MKELFSEFWKKQNSFEKKIYWIILLAGTIVTFVSIFQTLVQKLGPTSIIAPSVCFLVFLIILIISLKIGVRENLYIILCLCLYFVVMPFNYFACGGLKSGIPCFFVTSVILPTFGIKGKRKYITYILGMFALTVTMIASVFFPEWVSNIDEKSIYFDNIFSFVVCGIALFIFSNAAIQTYGEEKDRANKLKVSLEDLSSIDELTKLYNRRAFLSIFAKQELKNAFLLTIDIDNFKLINDSYSQHVGDRILFQSAEILLDSINSDKGEYAARYGGDKFVVLIYAKEEKDARERLDRMIKLIIGKEVPGFGLIKISINAGVVDCSKYDNHKEILKAADDALHSIKS